MLFRLSGIKANAEGIRFGTILYSRIKNAFGCYKIELF
jgi:hypothetical protein